jgi:hypothetical protein
MQRKFTMAFHILGAMGANADIKFTVPSDCSLVHVSGVQSDADAAGIEIGNSDDADEYLTKKSLGVSGTPNEWDGDDFVDSDGNTHTRYYPHITDGTVVTIAIDYDYNGGSGSGDASDVTVVLTFVEG